MSNQRKRLAVTQIKIERSMIGIKLKDKSRNTSIRQIRCNRHKAVKRKTKDTTLWDTRNEIHAGRRLVGQTTFAK